MHNLIHKNIIILIFIFLFSLVVRFITADTNIRTLKHNPTNSTFSPWLSGTGHGRWGCHHHPWICNEGGDSPPTRRLCCHNHCVEIDSDPYNCGYCFNKCPFTWQCCLGNCTDINSDTSNCGACGNKCQGTCINGLCGYAGEPPIPDPCPPWRRRHHWPCPWPPKPFPPKHSKERPGAPPVG